MKIVLPTHIKNVELILTITKDNCVFFSLENLESKEKISITSDIFRSVHEIARKWTEIRRSSKRVQLTVDEIWSKRISHSDKSVARTFRREPVSESQRRKNG